MAAYDWTDGKLLTLNPGDTATCNGGLNQQQLYGLFFYNVAQNDAGATVTVVWSNSQPPATVTVPGTTGNQGLAAILFVSGNDTNTVAAAMQQNQPGAQVQCFIGSVKMPVNTTGINNKQLSANGAMQSFNAFTRYYAVPQSHWYAASLESNINQFISVQFSDQSALVNVVNSLVDPSLQVQGVGQAKGQYQIQKAPNQVLQWNLQGNGGQLVWINADSIQNSQSAAMSLQSLAGLYELYNKKC